MSESGLFLHDDLLGHVPNPKFSGPGYGRSFHTIDADGLRSCGGSPASDDGPILAVGDSYTYGDEVRDEETWPAQLQRLTGRRVLNGGVTGYGFDQVVLRAEQLAARHGPAVIIVGFIADDIMRVEMRRMWWRNKPWFAIEEDRLVLRGVPVSDRTRLPVQIRKRLATGLLSLPVVLQTLLGYHRRVHPKGFGLKIAEKLIERLARLRADGRVQVILVAQYPPDSWTNRGYMKYQRRLVQAMFARAAQSGIATLDTVHRLATEPEPRSFYADWHMNLRGNLMVASLLSARFPDLTPKAPP